MKAKAKKKPTTRACPLCGKQVLVSRFHDGTFCGEAGMAILWANGQFWVSL